MCTTGGVRPASMMDRATATLFPRIGLSVFQANSWALDRRSYIILISVVSSARTAAMSSFDLPGASFERCFIHCM